MTARRDTRSARYRLVIGYDGTRYGGWQIQPNAPTVQAELEACLAGLAGHPVKVHGSGRTDQGVHARAQQAHFDAILPMPPAALVRALNSRLPADIRVRRAVVATPDFHARKSAIGKQYRYFIRNAAVMPPCRRLYETHVARPLDAARMRAAAERLAGRHDFSAFSANPDRELDSTVRDLFGLEVRKQGSLITIVADGEGFLYKMVRSLAGWLIRVGEGAEPPDATDAVLAARVRTARVPTAPPQGLFLWEVRYPP